MFPLFHLTKNKICLLCKNKHINNKLVTNYLKEKDLLLFFYLLIEGTKVVK